MSKDTYSTGATRHSDNNGERFDLISPHALRRLAVIMAEGAESHGERNWEKGLPKQSTIQHLTWHWNRYQLGDTSQDHLAKVMWGIMALLHFEEAGNPCDKVEVSVHGVTYDSLSQSLQEAFRPHHGALDDSDDEEKYLKYGGQDA